MNAAQLFGYAMMDCRSKYHCGGASLFYLSICGSLPLPCPALLVLLICSLHTRVPFVSIIISRN